MRFLMLSKCGEGANILHMIEEEGNDVELYIQEPGYRTVWDGLIPKVKKIAPKEGTIVICDFSGMGVLADKLKKSGFAVVGGSKFADRLEQDRQFGLDAMESCGIKVPLSMESKDFGDVEKFLEKNGKDGTRFVFKPSGKSLPTHLTYCAEDDSDLLNYVKYVQKYYSKDVESFVVQQFVEGVCVSSELWSDGSKFIRPANHTVEVKHFMDGCLGPSTGCSGNIVWVEPGDCRIVSEGVLLAEKLVVEAGYAGPLDLNVVANEEGVFGLEWTCRMGLDATPTLLHMFSGEVGKFFADVANGQVDHGMPVDSDKFGAGVRISIPPYPLEPERVEDVQKIAPNIGVPIRGITEKNVRNFYLYEVQENEQGELEHSAGTGLIACAIAVDEDPRHAFDKVYDLLEELVVPDLQYRTDLEHKLCKMHHEVEEQDRLSIPVKA